MHTPDTNRNDGHGPYVGFPEMSRPAILWTTGVFTTVAVLLRLHYFTDSDLPINDGALFYVYTAAILENDLALPTAVEFNDFTLPFAYPPLSFWFSSLLVSVFGFDLLGVVKYVPLVSNLGYLALFVAFLRALKVPWSTATLASAIFFLSHRSFEYLIMGGGLSRSTGAVFTLASWAFAGRLAHDRSSPWMIAAGICCAAAISTHLEWGIVSAVGITLVLAVYSRHWTEGLVAVGSVGALSAVLITPWLIWIHRHHGFDPFVHAARTSFWNPLETGFDVLYLNIFPWYLRIFCVIGVWEGVKNRRYFWILLTLSLALFTPRHFDTAAVASNSVLAAIGIFHLWRTLGGVVSRAAERSTRFHALAGARSAVTFPVLVVLTTLYVTLASYYQLGQVSMGTLRPEVRAAMRWIDGNVSEDARFAVVSPDPWYVDEVNEWFPLLANAISLTTVQGTEWVGGGEFARRSSEGGRLKALPCPYVTDDLVDTYDDADYALVVHRRECFREDPRFVPVHDNAGADVYRIRAGPR